MKSIILIAGGFFMLGMAIIFKDTAYISGSMVLFFMALVNIK